MSNIATSYIFQLINYLKIEKKKLLADHISDTIKMSNIILLLLRMLEKHAHTYECNDRRSYNSGEKKICHLSPNV